MKKTTLILLIIFIAFTKIIYSQDPDLENKQSIISYLDSTGYEFLALDKIIYFNIQEAIPIIESRFWQESKTKRDYFLITLNKLKAPNTVTFAHALIDTANNYIDTLDRISSIISATEILILNNDFLKVNYVFEWLNLYNNKLDGYYLGKSIIRVLPKLLDVPEYENQIKQQLYFIAQNEEDSDYRLNSTNALVKKYGQETIPFLLERINGDTTSYVRWNAFENLNKLNYPEIKSIMKSYLTNESEFIYRIRLADTLLNKYGQPTEYAFLKNYAQIEEDPRVKEMISLYTQYVKPPKQSISFSVSNGLDSLSSYTNKINKYSWLGDITFVEQLNLKLTTAKTNLQSGDSLTCRVQVKTFQDLIDNVYKDSLNTDVRFVTIECWNLLYWNAQYILDRLPEPPANPNLVVSLKNSLGNQIPASNVTYYENSWKDAVNNGDGTFTVITTKPTVSIRVYYEYASLQADNVPAQNNNYTFTTVNAAVQLKNSLGNLIDAGTVQYYAGAWRTFGATSNGVATKELLPINYSFRMTYEYSSIDKQQNLSSDPIVVFQTVNAAVQLKNSLGSFIDVGTVQYYAGAWRSFGTTSNGVAYKELLPINYSFRMTYEYGSIDKQQNLSSDPTVVFQTVNAAVQLKNSLGSLIDVGTVQYYAGAWRTFGTSSNGVAYKELLPINYSFRMTYEYVSKDKQQNLSTNPVVDFNTVLCSVKVSKTSNNQPINNAAVKYYAGAWRSLGTTNTNGIVTKELIPANISFRATVGNVSLDKQQDISVNNLVEILLNIP